MNFTFEIQGQNEAKSVVKIEVKSLYSGDGLEMIDHNGNTREETELF